MTGNHTSAAGGVRHAGGGWAGTAALVLGLDVRDVAERAGSTSFAALGGTSLRGIEFAALFARHHGRAVDVAALLGTEPLAAVVAGALPESVPAESVPAESVPAEVVPAEVVPAEVASPARASEPLDLARVQQAMLVSEHLDRGSAFHLLFSADIRGPLDESRLRSALARLTRRHAALRTVFVRGDDGVPRRRVLPRWQPAIIEQSVPYPRTDPIAAVHALLEPASQTLLRPYERPPVVFVLSRIGARRAVLSMLVHHTLVDGWSVGLVWRELAAAYAQDPSREAARDTGSVTAGSAHAPDTAAPSMDSLIAVEKSPAIRAAARRRADALRHLPDIVALPSDLDRPRRFDHAGARLHFGLSDEARLGCEALARAAGVTRNMVLLAAWALVVARRSAMPEFIMGMISAGRTTEESLAVVGPCMKQLPVVCEVADSGSIRDHLRATAAAVRQALAATHLPAEDIVAALGLGGDESRNPLVQVAFAAHDELIPEVLRAGDLTMELHEGHCGGTVYDAVLYVQRWGERPRLALEYATSVLRGDEAAELATAVDRVLVEMAAAPDGVLADVRTMTAAQWCRLAALGGGPEADAEHGLWQLFEAVARRSPDRVAVRDADPSRALTYRTLLRAAEAQSAALAAAGVTAGDCVALAVRRSAREVLALLAVLRLGAAYTGIEPGIPDSTVRTMLDSAGVRLVLGDNERLGRGVDHWHGRPVERVLDPWQVAPRQIEPGQAAPGHAAAIDRPVPAAAGADPARVAYVAFTSGSTGTPKGTVVPHRGVVRLALDPEYLRPGAVERFVRLAPLAFDASTLEIFAPLLAGGTIEVFSGEHVTPDGLAEFLWARWVTGLWLTAGLFRLVADYRPDAFRGVRQLLTGGDVVPPGQVAGVLSACPGLRVTNGYGPTENTTFTTTHHVEDTADVDDPLPIGRPIAGTGVLVLDAGGRLVPPGGVGELYTYGDGLASGYARMPEETTRAFGRFSADVDRRLYRTGDLVRWDGQGRLCFLGRRDRQVKIRGFRIELEAVARVLAECPGVADAVVIATGSGAADRRLLAGLASRQGASLLDSVRNAAAERLPGYALPSLWAVVERLPVTRNGKLDTTRLRELAAGGGTRPAQASATADAGATADASVAEAAGAVADAVAPASAGAADRRGEIARAVARAWRDVLGAGEFRADQRFFEVGGDSLQLLRVAASLRRDLPGHDVTIQDVYACQTIDALTARLAARARG